MRRLFASAGYLFSILKQAIVLDIWDLNYTYSNPRSFNRYLAIGSGWPIKLGILPRIASYFFNIVRGLFYVLTIRNPMIPPDSILLIAVTQNQTEGLRPMLDQFENCFFVKDRHNLKDGVVYPVAWAYLLSIFFLPVLLSQFWRRRQELDIYNICRYRLDGYWLAYGYYVVTRLWLNENKPRAIVLSNDHSMECRVWNKAARQEGITTFYLQHASVSDEFPPLSFDYALLDGLDAFEIYDRVGKSETQVYLVGNQKHDRFYDVINSNTVAKSAGICTNILDPLESVLELCKRFRREFPESILYLRPHPADKRFDEWRRIALTNEMEFSDPKQQNVYDFLQQVDMIVAGSSSIHVEAALLNVYPVYYDFSQNPLFQVYSFLERGLCEQAHSPDEVLARFAQLKQFKPNIRERAKPYCATIHTAFDGHSTQLVKEIVDSILSTGVVSFANWKPFAGNSVQGYQLID